ncbi:MAG: hypothetical protein RL033_3696 [Pseudomonadota bacterium]|jgi:hypothetical protein
MKQSLRVGVAVGAYLLAAKVAGAQEITLNAFGDINLGATFGDPASATDRTTFETYGEDPFVKSSHQGFGLVGTDFVLTGDLTDDFVFLGEINLQVARGQQSEFEVDVERMFVEKRFSQLLNLQAGLFFTPIGYFNRTLYSRAYFMNSVQIPDLFEEELGLIPTHTIGLQLHGQLNVGEHRLGYAVSLGNGRAADPVSPIYARDEDSWLSPTLMLEWHMPYLNELRLGVSGWQDRIESYRVNDLGEVRSVADPTTAPMDLLELGGDVHFVAKSTWVNLLAEAVVQSHSGKAAEIPGGKSSLTLWGGLAELSLNLGAERTFHPYFRYDFLRLPDDGGPFLSLRRDGDELTRVFVSDVSLGVVGVAWDAMAGLRLKAELSEALAGPRDKHAVVAQAAFAF